MAKRALMHKLEKSKRIASILGKKCALMCTKCNSCKKNMQEFRNHLIQLIYGKCTKLYSNFVPRLIWQSSYTPEYKVVSWAKKAPVFLKLCNYSKLSNHKPSVRVLLEALWQVLICNSTVLFSSCSC